MTPEQIDAMEAGPEMDALIATKVMGYTRAVLPIHEDDNFPLYSLDDDGLYLFYSKSGGTIWSPSSYIDNAWEVVEKLCQLFPNSFDLNNEGKYHWICSIHHGEAYHEHSADTAPLAICRAALKAVMT